MKVAPPVKMSLEEALEYMDFAAGASIAGTPIDVAFIGTCVNGRLRNLHAAAKILKGRRVAPGVRLMVSAASQKVFLDATKDGTIATLIEAGAEVGLNVLRRFEAPWTNPIRFNVRQSVLMGISTCPHSWCNQPRSVRTLIYPPPRFTSRTRWRISVSRALPIR